ncbi:HNH endonuclease [Companilactobacillus kimchiensis]|nr:HNH endonuclease [Companilactobacillus kimchiensis]
MYQYNQQLSNPNTNYFIIDSSSSLTHNDVDFKFYSYQNKSNKQLHAGDLIIYRRSGSASEWGNEFYLYGAAEFGEVVREDPETGSNLVQIKHPYLFSHHLMKQNLRTFDWKFRTFKGKWSNFFNMNGITQISKEDFAGLLERQKDQVPEEPELSPEEEAIAVKCYQAEKMESYYINDEAKGVKTYNAVQKFFNDKVKFNYHYKSALTGETNEADLVAVRIVPWVDNLDIRLDPHNGICLTKIFADAFTQGYFTFSDQGHIILSDVASTDPETNKTLNKYKNRKIYMNKEFSPNRKYLQYHREHVFLH